MQKADLHFLLHTYMPSKKNCRLKIIAYFFIVGFLLATIPRVALKAHICVAFAAKVLTQIYHVFCIPGGIPKVLIEFLIQILMYLVHFSDFLIALGKEGPASWALDKEGLAEAETELGFRRN